MDAVPEHGGDLSWLQKIPGMTAEASVGADVANVFGKRVYNLTKDIKNCIAWTDSTYRCIGFSLMRSTEQSMR